MLRLLIVWTVLGSGCAAQSTPPSQHASTDAPDLQASTLPCGFLATGVQKISLSRDASHVNREPTAMESRMMRPLIRTASRIRELSLKKSLTIRVQNQAAIRYYLNSQIKESDLKEANAVYGSLGLLNDASELGALLLEVLSEQVVGYYDPEHHYLVVRDDVLSGLFKSDTAETGEAHAVLIHEIVHALQDQHLSLGILHKQERTSDADGAFQSLVEGDATMAMLSYMGERVGVSLQQFTQNVDALRAIMANAPMSNFPSEKLDNSPQILKSLLLSPYTDGLVFAASLYREGGWQALNAAYHNLPTTTSQILHPEQFLHSRNTPLHSLPSFPKKLPGNYTLVYTDSLGELTWRVYASQALQEREAARLSHHWTADRIGVYQGPGGRLSAVWLGQWAHPSQAQNVGNVVAAIHEQSQPQQCRPLNHVRNKGELIMVSHAIPEAAQHVLERTLLQ